MLRNLAIAIALVAISACGGPISTSSKALNVEQTVAVPTAAKKLNLNNTFGAIKVIGEASRTDIQMKPTLKTSDPNAGNILVEASGDTMNVQVNNASGGTIAVDIEIHTPRALDFAVNTSGGALDLSGMAGSGTANTGSGNCTIDLDLGTSGKLTANTSSGAIALTLPNTTKASLTASAGSGSVTIASGLNFTGTNLMGNASGELNGGGSASVTLQASGGSITVNGK